MINANNKFSNLPNEVLIEIFEYLPAQNIFSKLSITSKRINELINNDYFLKYLIERDFKENPKNKLNDKKITLLKCYKEKFFDKNFVKIVLNFLKTATFSMTWYGYKKLEGVLFGEKTKVGLHEFMNSTVDTFAKKKHFKELTEKNLVKGYEIRYIFLKHFFNGAKVFFPKKALGKYIFNIGEKMRKENVYFKSVHFKLIIVNSPLNISEKKRQEFSETNKEIVNDLEEKSNNLMFD